MGRSGKGDYGKKRVDNERIEIEEKARKDKYVYVNVVYYMINTCMCCCSLTEIERLICLVINHM